MPRNSHLIKQSNWVLEAIDRIQEYVQGVTRETFETDRMRIDAVIRNLEVIGEAVK